MKYMIISCVSIIIASQYMPAFGGTSEYSNVGTEHGDAAEPCGDNCVKKSPTKGSGYQKGS